MTMQLQGVDFNVVYMVQLPQIAKISN